jgi:hypothetical protein
MTQTLDQSVILIVIALVVRIGRAPTGDQLPTATGALLEVATEMMSAPRKYAAVAAAPTFGRGATVATLAAIGNAIEPAVVELDGQ